MAQSLSDVVLFSKTVVEAKPWLQDPKCIPIPWREVEMKSALKLGVMWDDGIVTPTPPVKRALKETVEKLRRNGCEIVDWKPDGHKQALSILVSHTDPWRLLSCCFLPLLVTRLFC